MKIVLGLLVVLLVVGFVVRSRVNASSADGAAKAAAELVAAETEILAYAAAGGASSLNAVSEKLVGIREDGGLAGPTFLLSEDVEHAGLRNRADAAVLLGASFLVRGDAQKAAGNLDQAEALAKGLDSKGPAYPLLAPCKAFAAELSELSSDEERAAALAVFRQRLAASEHGVEGP